MRDYITLLGAEDVSKAGYNMMSAAEIISRATANLDDTLERNRQFMTDWLQTFERILSEYKP